MLTSSGQTASLTRRQLQAHFTREAKRRLKEALANVRAEKKRISRTRSLSATKLRALCRASKKRARERARRIKAEHKQAAKLEAEAILQSARGSCDVKRERLLKQEGKHLAALQLEADRARERYLAERLSGALARQDRKHRSTAAERRQESDDEVRRNIAGELVPVFEAVKRNIREAPGMSRTEAFEHWVHDNADEVASIMAEQAEHDVRKFIEQAQEKERAIAKMLKQKTVTEDDLRTLDLSCDEVHELGLDCGAPDDVAAAYAAVHHPSQSDEPDPWDVEPFEPSPQSVRPAARKAKRKRTPAAERRAVDKEFRNLDRIEGARAKPAAVQATLDAERLRVALVEMGGMREPEAAAHLGWDESRVWRAGEAGLRNGLFERNTVNGELHVAGEPGKFHKLTTGRAIIATGEARPPAERKPWAVIPREEDLPNRPWLPRIETRYGLKDLLDWPALGLAAGRDLERLGQLEEEDYEAAGGSRLAVILSQNRSIPDIRGILDAAQGHGAREVRKELRRQVTAIQLGDAPVKLPPPIHMPRAPEPLTEAEQKRADENRHRMRGPERGETYAQAADRMLDNFTMLGGWRAHRTDGTGRKLKTPYVEGHGVRLYFKPQAVWGTTEGSGLNTARSLDVDRRGMAASKLADHARRFAR